MAKPRKKKRLTVGKRQIETALPKRQYKRINKMLYVVSGILLVVFGGGAALLGSGTPVGAPAPTPPPAVSGAPSESSVNQSQQFTTTPTAVPPTATPTP